MHTIKTYRKSFVGLSHVIVEVGTNAPKPDYEDRNTRTVLSICCDNHIDCAIDGVPSQMTQNVEIIVRGTDGAAWLADALEFALGKLRSQMPSRNEDETFERDLA
jgi:hypothetical protein